MGNASEAAALAKLLSEDNGLRSLGSSIERVVRISSDSDEGPRQLSAAILADAALSQKILKLANGAAYRGALSPKVSTISKAILLLGFETVRQAALASLLVEGLSDKGQARSLRKEAAVGLAASLLARRIGEEGAAPEQQEEAGLCGLFRNLGPMLLASRAYDKYAALKALPQTPPHVPNRAAHDLLGASPEQLALVCMRAWGLPERLCLGSCGFPTTDKSDPASWLKSCSCACLEAARIGADGGPDASSHLSSWSKSCAAKLGVEESMAFEAAESCLRQAELWSPSQASPHEKQATAVELPAPSETFSFGIDPEAALDMPGRLAYCAEKLSELSAAPGASSEDWLFAFCEGLGDAMGADCRALLRLDTTWGQFRCKIAMGEGAAALRGKMKWTPAKNGSDAFSLCHLKNMDFHMPDLSDPAAAALIPSWCKALRPEARSAMLLSLPSMSGKSPSIAYFDFGRPTDRLDPASQQMLRLIKRQATFAIDCMPSAEDC